jgi:beta-lactamase superfamily II metal-dependent hydrolase
VPTPTYGAIAFSCTAILICAVLVRRRVMLSAIGAGVLTASAVWIWAIPPREQIRPGILEMTAIDVGQGDSILLVLPDGRKLLADAGGLPFWTHSQLDIGEDVVSPYLWSCGISRIDAITRTHAHADHMGGMAAVMANFRPRELWLPQGIRDEEIGRLLVEARGSGISTLYHKADDDFQFGGANFRILAPNPDLATLSGRNDARRNDESLVMKVTYKNNSALLEADAEKPTERFISTEYPRADVLKVAHHGSASSTSAGLLAAVRPQFAVISVECGTSIITRGAKCWNGCRKRRYRLIAPTWTARPLFTWTARKLRLRFLRSTERVRIVAGVFFARRPAIFLDQLQRPGGILLAHQNDCSANREHILRSVQSRDLAVNADGLEQAADHHGFGLLFRVEHAHQFLIRIRAGIRSGRHGSSCRDYRRAGNESRRRLPVLANILHCWAQASK